MQGFKSQVYTPSESRQLKSRPGLADLFAEIDSKDLEKALSLIIRQNLQSIVDFGHKALQLLAGFASEAGGYKKTLDKFKKSGDCKEWISYLQDATKTIEQNNFFMLDTLCQHLSQSAVDQKSKTAIDQFRNNDCPSFLNPWVAWGRGSLVHSLADFIMYFNGDPLLDKQLKAVFKEHTEKLQDISHHEKEKEQQARFEITSFLEKDWVNETLQELKQKHKQFEARNYSKLVLDDKKVFLGPSFSGKPEGYGCLFSNQQMIYQGDFVDGKFDGIGQFFQEGELIYSGQFKKGTPNGLGAIFEKGIMRYRGEIQNGKRHGIGEERNSENKVIYRGWHFDNKRKGCGIIYKHSPNESKSNQLAKSHFVATPHAGTFHQQNHYTTDPSEKYLDVD